MLATIGDYSKRIEAGKRVEHKIINSLRQMGYKIEDPTSREDMTDKIDGWWIDKKGNRYPLQIKFRQSGDDIIFELIQDVRLNNEGRDMKSKAVLYLVADTHGKTRMFLTAPIKQKAKEVLDVIQKELKQSPFQLDFRGHGWEAKMQYDKAHGQKKLVAYFSPDLFDALAVWDLNIS